jgi:hypothetical protein
MPTTPTQRTDLPDIVFDDGDSRPAGADALSVTAREAATDRR